MSQFISLCLFLFDEYFPNKELLFPHPSIGFQRSDMIHWLNESWVIYLENSKQNSKIQNWRATKGFALIGHKRVQIYICLQLSSSIASFFWKPAHFEFPSYGGPWHIKLRWLKTVSSTFKELDFDVSLNHSLSIDGIKKLPNHWWTCWYYFRDTIGYHSNTMTC